MTREDEDLIQRLIEGEMDQEEFAGVQDRMRREPELLEAYVAAAKMDHDLSETFCELEEMKKIPQAGGVAAAPVRQPSNVVRFATVAASVAAVVVFALLGYWMLKPDEGETESGLAAAKMNVDDQAEWAVGSGDGGGSALREWNVGQRLRVKRGTVETVLPDGGRLLLSGPGELEYVGWNELRLRDGSLAVDMDASEPSVKIFCGDMEVTDIGTRFGVKTSGGKMTEVHVADGVVEAKSGSSQARLSAREALLVREDGKYEYMEARLSGFAMSLPVRRSLFRDDFRVSAKQFGAGDGWRIAGGSFQRKGGVLRSQGEAGVFRELDLDLGDDRSVMLVTVKTWEEKDFHSPGYAGVSLYAAGRERVFFGDCYGEKESWGLDVRRRGDPQHPKQPVTGARAVTLRYDWKTGEVALFSGEKAVGKPLVEATLEKGLDFEQIRISGGKGGVICVDSLEVGVME